jgi:integrase
VREQCWFLAIAIAAVRRPPTENIIAICQTYCQQYHQTKSSDRDSAANDIGYIPEVSNATPNRTLEWVRGILRKCVDEWEWLERAPKICMLKEPVRRTRFLRHEEAQRLIAALPEHFAAMASFSLSTGLRAANVTGLQWTQVDLVRRVAWIHPDQAARNRCRSITTPCYCCVNAWCSIRCSCLANTGSASRRSARRRVT